jgi:hypothetical protein
MRLPNISSATSPPTHSDAATRWNSRLLVARSCWPPDAEWPVTATGVMPRTANPKRAAVQPQVSTSRVPTAMASAITAVISHAFVCSNPPIRSTKVPPVSTSASDLLARSAAVNAMDINELRHQSPAAQDAVRSAAYPPTCRIPVRCGETMNAANMSEPTVRTLAISAIVRAVVSSSRLTRLDSPAVRLRRVTAVSTASRMPMSISGTTPAVGLTRTGLRGGASTGTCRA